LRIKHQTGPSDFEKVEASYRNAGWTANVVLRQADSLSCVADVSSYIDNMVDDFAKADLVICRAGATTTAELIAAGKAALMIPFPFAADDHQRKNAEALQVSGAARMILQQDLTGERLAKEIIELAQQPSAIDEMETSIRKLQRGDAAAAAVNIIEKLANRN
jgi:UDP-N-acetylglucosamine--N-acetylmuramyl-(pentapeptide) pyrophosphoryl-undecaprenol N-acetylglucosamine transferase